jgi:hypothetical protein
MARRRPKRSEALHTTHRTPSPPAQEILSDGGTYSERAVQAESARVIWATPVRPGRSTVGGARNVLTSLAVGLTIWLYVGALTAQLFGAFVSGGHWDLDEDD